MAAPALFATSREALTFAANHSAGGRYQVSIMARMMQGASERCRPASGVDAYSALDRSGQAGLILQLLNQLPDETVHALLAAVLRPRNACACRAPCCSGFRPNEDWVRSALIVDGAVVAQQDAARQPGRKTLVTSPALRTAIVEQFFDRSQQETQTALAERLGLSEETVSKHRKAIGKMLVGMVRSGFSKLDEVLVEAGIVGSTE